jgi:hypothetical protein
LSSGTRKPSETSPELREILTSPLQQSGVTLSVQAAPFKNKPKEASVAVAIEVEAQHLRFEQTPNGYRDNLEVTFFAVDDKGKQHQGAYYNLNLTLRPETYERVKQRGVRVNPRLTLAPGRYQVRVGVRESGAGELGSVFYDLDIPDFTKNGISMSGVLMTAPSSTQVLTPEVDATVTPALLPGPATSRREFRQSDTLNMFGEVYDNVRDARHQIDAVTTLLAENGTEVFKSTQTLGGNPQGSPTKNATLQYSAAIPLKQIQPGRYLLRVEASVRGAAAGDAGRTSRETLITVVP